jgi:amidase
VSAAFRRPRDPELMAHYGHNRVTHAGKLAGTVKVVALCGRHSLIGSQGRHYAMARNVAAALRRACDTALEHFDVLAMPETGRRLPHPTGARPVSAPNH